MRKCTRCGETDQSKFSTHRYYCRACVRYHNRKHAEKKGIPEKFIPLIAPGMKQCAMCKDMKSLTEYSNSKRGRFGKSAYCKPCASLYQLGYITHETRRERTRLYRENNKYWWRFLHRLHQFNCRQLIKKTADGSVTKEFLQTLYDEVECYYCKEEVSEDRKTMEHKHPLVKGGAHSAHNLVMACLSCNSSKAGKTEQEYIIYLKRKGNDKDLSRDNS